MVKYKTGQIGDIVLVAHVANADDIALNIGGYINIDPTGRMFDGLETTCSPW